MSSAFRRLHKRESKKKIKTLGAFFPYRAFLLYFFPKHEFETLVFSIVCAQNVARFCYAAAAFLFLEVAEWVPLGDIALRSEALSFRFWVQACSGTLGFIVLSFVVGDFLPRILGTKHAYAIIRFCAPPSTLFLLLTFPFSYVFLKLSQSLSSTVFFDHLQEPQARVKEELIELIREADVESSLDPHDKKLISSVVTFRERIAREVMVPRVDIFSLPAETTIKEATRLLEHEEYSRTPVYRNNIDNIVGVLMYKDILNKYREYEQMGNQAKILEAPIETILKNVLYAPENKKISNLLQEFRKKQVHLAIVVDEYGGTEGIVTIEDILEEIVGEIADEYDEEEKLYEALPDGGWIVDARMSILDIEDQLGIKIPQDGEYDTLGGYIFQNAGSIPSKGFIIHHDDFELEILSSNERSIEKVRIKPSARYKEKINENLGYGNHE